MLALELEKHFVFSNDGGETWLVVKEEPKDIDDKLDVWVQPHISTSLSDSFHLLLDRYEYVWEPDSDALNRGDDYLPVKRDNYS